MKVLVTGCIGQFGYDVSKLTKHGDTAIAVDVEEMDITDKEAVDNYIGSADVDATKIHNELGWLPETKFEDGIKKTIQ